MSDDEIKARLIVTDTGPLITLAAADCLDYLLYPDVPVYIPDAVLYEATVNSAALGAESIAAWVQAHPERIFIIATETYANALLVRDIDPTKRVPNLGETAALEAIRKGIRLAPDERAVLITEDDRVLRGSFILVEEARELLIPITTRDFLTGLEDAGRINSVDEVYRRAEDSGRKSTQRQILQDQHKAAADAVEKMIKRKPGSDTTP